MIEKTLSAVFCIVACAAILGHADSVYTSTSMGYAIYLPDNWVAVEKSDTQHHFYDTTGASSSFLSLERFRRSSTDFPSASEWTRAHFLAYLIAVEYGFDPWGVVLFYDSSASATVSTRWSPMTYSRFYALDTALGTWDEYCRTVCTGQWGYMLYATGDTLDMTANVGLYAAILGSMELPADEVLVTRPRAGAPVRIVQPHGAIADMTYDVLGRAAAPGILTRRVQGASGIYLELRGRRGAVIR